VFRPGGRRRAESARQPSPRPLSALFRAVWQRATQSSLRVMLSNGMAANAKSSRRWFVRGRVQGVGFRYFAQRAASELALTGYVRNLEDGSVEVYAAGTQEQLSRFAALLQRGPRGAQVRTVDEQPADTLRYGSFVIEP
jgi:acylphosphatase